MRAGQLSGCRRWRGSWGRVGRKTEWRQHSEAESDCGIQTVVQKCNSEFRVLRLATERAEKKILVYPRTQELLRVGDVFKTDLVVADEGATGYYQASERQPPDIWTT